MEIQWCTYYTSSQCSSRGSQNHPWRKCLGWKDECVPDGVTEIFHNTSGDIWRHNKWKTVYLRVADYCVLRKENGDWLSVEKWLCYRRRQVIFYCSYFITLSLCDYIDMCVHKCVCTLCVCMSVCAHVGPGGWIEAIRHSSSTFMYLSFITSYFSILNILYNTNKHVNVSVFLITV